MLIANINLIPSYDMLGLPAPAWLVQFLTALTLALHWVFLSMTAGGAAAHILMRRGLTDAQGKRKTGIAAFLPFSLTMAMTMGIGPLLFVQVLYGNFFYTANILMGYVWLGLLVLVIGTFYMLYYGWYRLKQGRSTPGVGVLVLLLMAGSAVILSANATLMQNPGDWQGFRAMSGVVPYLGDATFLPRWSLAIFALISGGGLFVAIFMRIWASLYREPSGGVEIRNALTFTLVGLIGVLACGFWGCLSLPQSTRDTLLSGPESIFPYAAAVAFAASFALALVARRSHSLRNLILPCVTFFVALLCTAAVRDTMRRIALAEHFDLTAIPVNSQWGSFVLFAVLLVLGLGIVAYMVKLAFTPKPQSN